MSWAEQRLQSRAIKNTDEVIPQLPPRAQKVTTCGLLVFIDPGGAQLLYGCVAVVASMCIVCLFDAAGTKPWIPAARAGGHSTQSTR